MQGYQFAKGISEDGSSYETTALSVLCFLQDFWVPSGGFIDANSEQANPFAMLLILSSPQ